MVSLTVHWLLLVGFKRPEPIPTPSDEAAVADLTSADAGFSLAVPITLEQALPAEPRDPNVADRRRAALINHLDLISDSIHARASWAKPP